MDCLRQLTTASWGQVLQSGGRRGKKAGLGCTRIERDAFPAKPPLSDDLSVYEVRFSKKGRIWGAYHDHVLYVFWFDPKHAVLRG